MYFGIKTYQDKLTQLERIETNILGDTFEQFQDTEENVKIILNFI